MVEDTFYCRQHYEELRAEKCSTCDEPLTGEILRTMRPHQWVKNVLLWVPLMLGHGYDDAAKVFDVLTKLGRVSPENAILLQGEPPDTVRRVLIAVNDRIRADVAAGDEAVLFVYYSGHADAQSLHLGDAELEIRMLRQLVRGSAATVRLLMLDACRSGSLTRVKGVQPTQRFDVKLEESLDHQGMVLLTSSSATEAGLLPPSVCGTALKSPANSVGTTSDCPNRDWWKSKTAGN